MYANTTSSTHNDLKSTSYLPHLLKGADEIVYSVAQSLGLSVIVKPVIKDTMYFPSNCILLKHFPDFCTSTSYYDEEDPCEVFTGNGHPIHHITWCQKYMEKFNDSQQEVAGCIETYGNETDVGVYYQIAAILVTLLYQNGGSIKRVVD